MTVAGRIYQVTDPKGIINQTTYDNANRTTQTVADTSGLAQTVNYTYTLDNQIATLEAINSTTGNQTTTYTYGTTLRIQGWPAICSCVTPIIPIRSAVRTASP